jgi:hypothetical protein
MRMILFNLCILIVCLGGKADYNLRLTNLKYKGCFYYGTLNKSFINKRLVFLNGKDSVFVNIKIAFDAKGKKTYDPGIFYNCQLEKDSIYSFSIKKIAPSEIPKEYNTYYRTNCIFNTNGSSRFKEVKKNTQYYFVGNTGIYVDINHELFKIMKMTPARGCTMQL